MRNVAVLIQGPVKESSKEFLKKNVSYLDEFFPNYDIILSTQTDDEDILEWVQDELKIRVLKCPKMEDSNMFSVLNMNNFGNQVITSHFGLIGLEDSSDLKYDYAIKIRSDEYFQNYLPLIEKMEENPDKIVCSNYFFRKDFPYHIGDHIIAGSFDNVKMLITSSFDRLMDACNNFIFFEDSIFHDNYHEYIFNDTKLKDVFAINEAHATPESRLAINYLLAKGENPICKNHKELMNKYFDVVDVTEMGDFECRSNLFNIAINQSNCRTLITDIFDKEEHQCRTCPSFMICKERERQAVIWVLMRSSIKDMSELTDLEDDLEIFTGVYKPWKQLEQFKNCVKI